MIEIAKGNKVYNYLMSILRVPGIWDWDKTEYLINCIDESKNWEIKLDGVYLYIYENKELIFQSSDFILAESLCQEMKKLFETKEEEKYNECMAKEIEEKTKQLQYLESKIVGL
jgi:hypothetical protein